MSETMDPRVSNASAQPGIPHNELEELLIFLRDARGFDFTGYKRSTLARRINKRMQEVGITDHSSYRDRLETDPVEFQNLFNTILINVTSFFRDADAWAYLRQEIIPDLLSQVGETEEIRVWSAGCSTGEEAYSLAIVFAEALGLPACIERVKIYGTDVDEEALRDARTGAYPAKALEPLPTELRDRYFDAANSRYILRPDLRRRVIFGRHDITRDAPISQLDLLVCRNTLMYFNVEAQSMIVDRFHFALKEGRYLFLGKAEMLLSDGERFEVASMRQRVFRRRPGHPSVQHHPALLRIEGDTNLEGRAVARRRQIRDLMIEATPFATIGVDLDGIVVAISAEARSQFGLATNDLGRPFHELELSYRPIELRSLIQQAHRERRGVRVNALERRSPDNDLQYFDVLIKPLWGSDVAMVGTSVTFFDTTTQVLLQQEVKRVREDLETAYEELQSTNEELETTNEELQSSIEELETTNEELQSTNEELETTNEELQSGNEELETMNEEMRIRTGELDEARTFLEGVLSSIGAGVVVLDSDVRVRTWSRGAEELWGLRPDEVHHQPFFGLDFGLPTARLREVVQECQDSKRRIGPVELAAVNRIGRSITCAVTCSPLDSRAKAVVLLMEEVHAPTGSHGTPAPALGSE